jgi:ribosomal protein S3AE
MGMKSKSNEKEEKEVELKESAKLEKEATADEEEKKIVVKKWKGKDWFSILAPPLFDSTLIAQTPTTDPKNLVGRNIEVNVYNLTNDMKKQHMKIIFSIDKVEGKSALTRINGFECLREHIMRMVRKRNKKVQCIFDAKTKDNWLLKVTFLSILNGSPGTDVQKESRLFVEKTFMDAVQKMGINDLILSVINNQIQMKIKKEGSKIYPVRFCEVEKIRVVKHSEETAPVTFRRERPYEQREERPSPAPVQEVVEEPMVEETPKAAPAAKKVKKPKAAEKEEPVAG